MLDIRKQVHLGSKDDITIREETFGQILLIRGCLYGEM